MSLVATLQAAHEELIEENPLDVTITRVEKIREGGGFNNVTSTVGTIRARLYQEATGRQGGEEGTSTAGKIGTDARWGLLCPAEMTAPGGATIPTELRFGPNVQDSFETPLGRFEITAVYPRQDEGEIWGWQATVQRIT
jgi:hypothetical protein